MSRWLAPAVGGLGLLVLVVGLYRTHAQAGASGGVTLVVWGLVGLALATVGAGAAELAQARRRPALRSGGPAPRAAGRG